jgi:hypothetical protein
MKKLMVMVSLITSITAMNANALEAVGAIYGLSSAGLSTLGTLSSIYGPDCVIGQGSCKEAVQVLEDAQAYLQSGKVSTFLGQKIKEVQNIDSTLSSEEAIDVLTSTATAVLK